jgi:hypothetical protein
MTSEADIQSAILLTFGARPELRLWRSNTGAAQTVAGRWVRYGVPGQADISGIRLPHGQFVQIEVKSATGRQTEAQRKWQRMVEKFGGLYVLARSVEDVERAMFPKGDPIGGTGKKP